MEHDVKFSICNGGVGELLEVLAMGYPMHVSNEGNLGLEPFTISYFITL